MEMDLIQLQMEEKRLSIKKATLEIELLEHRLKVRTCVNINLHVKSVVYIKQCNKKKNDNFTFIVFQEIKNELHSRPVQTI